MKNKKRGDGRKVKEKVGALKKNGECLDWDEEENGL